VKRPDNRNHVNRQVSEVIGDAVDHRSQGPITIVIETVK